MENVRLQVKSKPPLISLCNIVFSKQIREGKAKINTDATFSSILLLTVLPPFYAPSTLSHSASCHGNGLCGMCAHRQEAWWGFTLSLPPLAKWYRGEMGVENHLHIKKYYCCLLHFKGHHCILSKALLSLTPEFILLDIQLFPPLRARPVLNRHICTNPSGQDGCHMQLCGCQLVHAILQSISQLIELLSITMGFVLSQSTPSPFIEVKMAAHLILLIISYSEMQMFFQCQKFESWLKNHSKIRLKEPSETRI